MRMTTASRLLVGLMLLGLLGAWAGRAEADLTIIQIGIRDSLGTDSTAIDSTVIEYKILMSFTVNSDTTNPVRDIRTAEYDVSDPDNDTDSNADASQSYTPTVVSRTRIGDGSLPDTLEEVGRFTFDHLRSSAQSLQLLARYAGDTGDTGQRASRDTTKTSAFDTWIEINSAPTGYFTFMTIPAPRISHFGIADTPGATPDTVISNGQTVEFGLVVAEARVSQVGAILNGVQFEYGQIPEDASRDTATSVTLTVSSKKDTVVSSTPGVVIRGSWSSALSLLNPSTTTHLQMGVRVPMNNVQISEIDSATIDEETFSSITYGKVGNPLSGYERYLAIARPELFAIGIKSKTLTPGDTAVVNDSINYRIVIHKTGGASSVTKDQFALAGYLATTPSANENVTSKDITNALTQSVTGAGDSTVITGAFKLTSPVLADTVQSVQIGVKYTVNGVTVLKSSKVNDDFEGTTFTALDNASTWDGYSTHLTRTVRVLSVTGDDISPTLFSKNADDEGSFRVVFKAYGQSVTLDSLEVRKTRTPSDSPPGPDDNQVPNASLYWERDGDGTVSDADSELVDDQSFVSRVVSFDITSYNFSIATTKQETLLVAIDAHVIADSAGGAAEDTLLGLEIVDRSKLFIKSTTPVDTILGSFPLSSTDTPLPVELSSFIATARAGEILLEWVTESEINNIGFRLERSTLPTSGFERLADYVSDRSLRGALNSASRRHYSFTDQTVEEGITYYYRLVSIDLTGIEYILEPIVSVTTPRKNNGDFPVRFALEQNYPNPFNPTTEIRYQIPQESWVTLTIFNLRGQVVTTLVDQLKAPGVYTARWDATNLAGHTVSNGVYLYQIRAGTFYQTRKMILIK